jgi:ATP-dependent 26S proteasome regulatory subunit
VNTPPRWDDANQRYLLAALALVRHALKEQSARLRSQEKSGESHEQLQKEVDEATASLPAPAALARLRAVFRLSPFERDLLLLCAGIELDSGFRLLCAQATGQEIADLPTGSTQLTLPTFSLALAALPGAHWDALAPGSPLRYWRLITLGNGPTLVLSPLRIDETILHWLVGLPYADERVGALHLTALPETELVSSHRAVTERLVAIWTRSESSGTGSLPLIQLCGDDSASKRAIAAHACDRLNIRLHTLSAENLPGPLQESEMLVRLWERKAALTRSALLLDCDELDPAEVGRTLAVTRFLQEAQSPVILSSRERQRLLLRQPRPVVTLDVQRPETSEQRHLWEQTLSALNVNLNGQIDRLAMQFNLNSAEIHAASAQILQQNATTHADNAELEALLWEACRTQARPALDDLAQRIESPATWEDLVLPETQQQLLHEVVAHVRQRATVYETWGFSSKGARGLGISALFAGSSGTGKTLAAEVLAHELHLDLYRIDLSSVVSKYIGETEKNLRRIFDAAEQGGAILLFDEADALFGKRSEVKDSHDRYANIEVSYLLQRMEAYRGLAILTTNLKSALDSAFLRRIRFIVQFPFPDAAMRAEIWQRIFPSALPTENLDIEKLARLHVAGGNIRNIALHAAFLAADAREPVKMAHLLRAAATEYTKLEKPLTEAEIGGWI